MLQVSRYAGGEKLQQQASEQASERGGATGTESENLQHVELVEERETCRSHVRILTRTHPFTFTRERG